MGVCLSTHFDKKFPGDGALDEFTDAKGLAGWMGLLDLICFEKGVMLLSTFAPHDEIYEAYWKTTGRQLEASFDPSDGLRTISTLLKVLESDVKWAKCLKKRDAHELAGDLRLLEKKLKAAKKHRSRFYMLYY